MADTFSARRTVFVHNHQMHRRNKQDYDQCRTNQIRVTITVPSHWNDGDEVEVTVVADRKIEAQDAAS